MKVFIIILISTISTLAWSQNDSIPINTKYSKVIKHDGTEFIGVILKDNEREILLKTKTMGNIIIPKHTIKKIEAIDQTEVKDDGEIWPINLLSSRYTLTTNGLPVKKGEGYVRFMPIGTDFQFPITDSWSIGGMTSWYGIPLIVTSKVSQSITNNFHVSAGFLYGNLMHGAGFSNDPFLSYGGGIGFGNITIGNEERNLNVSGGYGFVHFPGWVNNARVLENHGTTMFSIAGMARISKQAVFIFDSMGLIVDGSPIYWVNPAVRYMPKPTNIWQFGISMAGFEDTFLPVPLPMISFTKVFKK